MTLHILLSTTMTKSYLPVNITRLLLKFKKDHNIDLLVCANKVLCSKLLKTTNVKYIAA